MAGLSIIGISGSVTRPSRTTALVQAALERIEARSGAATRLVELVDSAPALFSALTRDKLTGEAKALVQAVEQADLLVIGTPVYRASYTGALKHLFDLVHHAGFAGKPVLLTATGGSHLHGLVTEHQLRPLFGFLNALTFMPGVDLRARIHALNPPDRPSRRPFRSAHRPLSAPMSRACRRSPSDACAGSGPPPTMPLPLRPRA